MIGFDHRMLSWIRCQRYLLSKYEGQQHPCATCLLSIWLTNDPYNLLHLRGPFSAASGENFEGYFAYVISSAAIPEKQIIPVDESGSLY